MNTTKLRRLRRMGIAEIAYRGREQGYTWLDRSGVPARLPAPRTEPLVRLDPARFFAGAVSVETAGLAAQHAPDACRELVASANDNAFRRRFDLLGYRAVSFGDPVEWHFDPIARVRAPLVHWSRLDVLDPTQVGDSKVPWELNRQQWLVGLGQAYRLTENEAYCESFVEFVRQWIEANPNGQGINWASSLEVALRLISWLWALFLFRGGRALTPAFVGVLARAIADHAAHIERHLSYYSAPNTHLTGEALGLLYAGLLLPEARRARQWRLRGVRILTEQCDRQILPDGVYCEQSTCYQRYTAEIYLHAMMLGGRNGVAFPAAVNSRVQSLLDFLLWVRAPNGAMPMVGDADGGWLLPLTRRAPDDLRGVFSSAAAWFGRSDYAWAAGGSPAPETLWLLGREGIARFAGSQSAVPARDPSRLFPTGGYVVTRSGWTDHAHQLILDVGPLSEFGHAHADLLSVQCSAFGEPYVVDPGTYCYTADKNWRDHFRGAAAHNTVTIDGLDQALAAGPFGWGQRPAARLRRWRSTESTDFADAEHDGYRRLADPVAHRRRVLFVKPRYWVLVDDLQGGSQHRIDLRFQFAPMEVSLDAGCLWARAHGGNGRGLLIRAFATVPLGVAIREGGLGPREGWVSPDYGQRSPAPVLIYSAVARLPLRIVTLLHPAEDVSAAPPAVSTSLDEHAELSALVFAATGERIRFDEDLISVSAAGDANR